MSLNFPTAKTAVFCCFSQISVTEPCPMRHDARRILRDTGMAPLTQDGVQAVPASKWGV